MSLPAKDPDNIEPYFIVWCDPEGINDGLAADDGELQGATIVTATWTVPSGITKVTDNTDAITIHGVVYPINTVAAIWLQGGTSGKSYYLNCRIVTSDGRTLDRTIEINVRTQ